MYRPRPFEFPEGGAAPAVSVDAAAASSTAVVVTPAVANNDVDAVPVPLSPKSPQFIVRPSASALSLNSFSYSHFSRLLKAKDYAAVSSYISYVFSSALILNASFLPRASVGGGSFIDHNLLELTYSKLFKASLQQQKLHQVLAAALQKMVASMVALMKRPQPPPKVSGQPLQSLWKLAQVFRARQC